LIFAFIDLFFGGTGVWTYGLMTATQALYHFSHSTNPPAWFLKYNE
jgi:hypothetical protein